jgi:hypothetical protein
MKHYVLSNDIKSKDSNWFQHQNIVICYFLKSHTVTIKDRREKGW